jgi:hypothetical protein
MSRLSRLGVAAGPALALVMAMGAVAPVGPAVAQAASTRLIADAQWANGADWRSGRLTGLRVSRGALVLAEPTRARRYRSSRYDVGTWTSAWTAPGYGLTELIASWHARTPGDSWLEVRVRGRVDGARTSWDVLARWAATDRRVLRTSVPNQDDDLADVAVDTWRVGPDAGAATYQLQVRLMRRTGATSASPRVEALHAVASRLPDGAPATSKPGKARGLVLEVPSYSQMIHEGHSPQYGGGGEAWCSPTSTAMVLGFYDALPAPASYRWVGADHPDPWVDAAARATYDQGFEGAGNWPFNTAYAAGLTGAAHVTRLPSLRAAEAYLVAGTPLVISVAFGAGELAGAPITSTPGHLMVLVGMTEDGDPVVNDPAARTNAGVRRTYDRAELERAWLAGSGGTTYVITTP